MVRLLHAFYAVVGDYRLVEEILVSNQVASLEHPSHPLQVVLRERLEQGDRLQEQDPSVLLAFHNTCIGLPEFFF